MPSAKRTTNLYFALDDNTTVSVARGAAVSVARGAAVVVAHGAAVVVAAGSTGGSVWVSMWALFVGIALNSCSKETKSG